jgi:hypothetical protein
VSGGDIRNAVLKAALTAADAPGSEAFKAIHQQHFVDAMRDVIAGKQVMRQSLLDTPLSPAALMNTGRLASVPPGLLATVLSAAALVVSLVALTYALAR